MSLKKYLTVFAVMSSLTLGRAVAAPIVHPGDTISVDVLNYAAVVDDSNNRLAALNAGSVVVAADGSISIPVVGAIRVAGESTGEIAALIEKRLSPYVRNPAVTVRLLQQNQVIFLTGATTGTLPYLPGETLSSALGQLREQFEKDLGPAMTPIDKNGGTLSRSAIDLRSIVVERDRHTAAPIDGEQLLSSGRLGPSLAPGDTLLFANKPVRVDVRGEVAAPGAIYLYRGDTLEQALLEAGGVLPSASTADASLLRQDGEELPLPLGGAALREISRDGDTIVVRAAPHVTVLGQVPTPGEFTLKNGATLLSALYVAGGPTKWANVRDIEVVHNGDRKSYDLRGLQHGDLAPNVPLADGDVVYVPEGHRIDASVFFQGLLGALGGVYDASHL
jgi:protein involved in polysaccharide export with SLBB domain